MKRLIVCLAFLGIALGFAAPARAQFTTVTGTVIDPNGWPYAGATVTAILVPASSGPWRLNGQPYAGQMPNTNLDASGSFRSNVGDNSIILPAGTQWQFTVNSQAQMLPGVLGTGAQSFTVTLTISGASQDISAQLTAAAKVVSNACKVGASCGGGGGGMPAPPVNSVQFNSPLGTFDGDAQFTWVDSTEQGFVGPGGAALDPDVDIWTPSIFNFTGLNFQDASRAVISIEGSCTRGASNFDCVGEGLSVGTVGVLGSAITSEAWPQDSGVTNTNAADIIGYYSQPQHNSTGTVGTIDAFYALPFAPALTGLISSVVDYTADFDIVNTAGFNTMIGLQVTGLRFNKANTFLAGVDINGVGVGIGPHDYGIHVGRVDLPSFFAGPIQETEFFDVTETAAPANPPSGLERWYGNSTSHLFSCLTSTGGSCAGGGSSGTVTSVGLLGTANQITVTGASPITTSGSWTLSIPNNPTLPGTTTGTFSGPLTGNVTGNVSGSAGSFTGNLTGDVTSSGMATTIAATGATAASCGDTTHSCSLTINTKGQITANSNNVIGSPVSSVFGRTGAVVATSGDYTLDLIGNPTAAKTFTMGANTPLLFNSTGVFTTGTQNESLSSVVGGTFPCPYHAIAGSGWITDALSGCAVIPASGVTNGFSTGVSGYVQNNNPNSTGQFGKVEGVGLYGACESAANNTFCLGMAAQAVNGVGATGVFMEGAEISVTPGNTGDTGFGILLSTEGASSQPTGDNLPALVIQTPGSTGTWTSGLECADGSTSSTFCIRIGKSATGNGKSSQVIGFTETNDSGVSATNYLYLDQDNTFLFAGPRVGIANAAGEESYSVALTATAALVHGTLVKIDSANSDAAVICTTADTFCNGFTQGTNSVTTGFCGAGLTNCGIVTTPGSKVQGILGTGTCAIGNYVIIDTTTNGRVKCTATLPTTVNIVGYALSAQSSVGSLVDILTSFSPVTGILTGTTAAIGGSALLPGACAAGTATVTGATSSMTATASPSADPDSTLSTGIAIYSFVSSTNTVTVRVCAIVSVTPASVTYNVRVLQ